MSFKDDLIEFLKENIDSNGNINIDFEKNGITYHVLIRAQKCAIDAWTEDSPLNFKSIQKMFNYMKETGGHWVASDDPWNHAIGYRSLKNEEWARIRTQDIKDEELKVEYRDLIRTAAGRKKIGENLCAE